MPWGSSQPCAAPTRSPCKSQAAAHCLLPCRPWHTWQCCWWVGRRGAASHLLAVPVTWPAVGVERHSLALVGEQWAYCDLGPLWMHVLQKLPINSDSFPPNCFILFLSAFLSSRCLGAPLSNAEPGDGVSGCSLFYLVAFFLLVIRRVPAQPFSCCAQGCCGGQAWGRPHGRA